MAVLREVSFSQPWGKDSGICLGALKDERNSYATRPCWHAAWPGNLPCPPNWESFLQPVERVSFPAPRDTWNAACALLLPGAQSLPGARVPTVADACRRPPLPEQSSPGSLLSYPSTGCWAAGVLFKTHNRSCQTGIMIGIVI